MVPIADDASGDTVALTLREGFAVYNFRSKQLDMLGLPEPGVKEGEGKQVRVASKTSTKSAQANASMMERWTLRGATGPAPYAAMVQERSCPKWPSSIKGSQMAR